MPKLRFKKRIALSYFSAKLINAAKLINIEPQITTNLKILKFSKIAKKLNAEIRNNSKLVIKAK